MAVTAKKAPGKRTGTAKQAARETAAKPSGAAETRVFRVSFHGEASIWRCIVLRAEETLYALAQAAVRAFDFDLDHAFGFYPEAGAGMYRAMPRYELFSDMGDPTDAGVQGVEGVGIDLVFPLVGKLMVLLFDYGDEWLFDVKLTAKGQTEPRARYPRLPGQGGKAPRQYS